VTVRIVLRWLLAISYAAAGYFHIATPDPFLRIMPGWVPYEDQVVFWTGIAEFVGAAALVQPRWPGIRRAGAMGLALYALCVWPANINHMMIDLAHPGRGLGLAYHIPRMALQPVLIWLALWTGGVVEWPWRRPQPSASSSQSSSSARA